MPKNIKRKKQLYKNDKYKNSKYYIIIGILILLLMQFIALGLSRAQKMVEVELFLNDTEEFIQDKSLILNAIDSGESGSFIVLPEQIDGVYITEYIVENEGEENNDIKTPGEKLYLSEEELSNRELNLGIVYHYKEIGEVNERLYYQELYEFKETEVTEENENKEHLENISLTGFMPYGLSFEIDNETKSDVVTLLSDENSEIEKTEKIFKIKSKLDSKKYDFNNLEEDITIRISPTKEEKTYYVYSFKKKEEYKDVEEAKDALGNYINIYNIQKEDNYIFNKENIEINIRDFEYIGIVSKDNQLQMMQRPMGSGGMVMFGMEIPTTFDINSGTDIWDGSVSTGFVGNGSQNNPYLISSGADLAYLGNRVSAGTTFENNYFQITNDIDLDNRIWEPIGTYNNSFRGNLDGAGRTIKNARINANGTIPGINNGVHSFGFFGSIGGSTTNRQVIENLQLDEISIVSQFSGQSVTSTTDRIFGINMGTLAGTMYQNSTISNVNIRNLDISDSVSAGFRVRSYRFQFLVGGLVGEATRLPLNATAPAASARYEIVNSAVDGNINLNTYGQNIGSSAQVVAGGIIGRIRSQPVWPDNSIFRGNITIDGFIGPIFGQLRNNTNVNRSGNFNTLWQGNDAGNLTCTSGYNSFRANNTSFTTTVVSGTSNSRRGTNTDQITYVQGMNKGSYVSNTTTIVNSLNGHSASNNVKWQYTGGSLHLRPRLKLTVSENPESTYSMNIDDSYYSATPYQYRWILNGVTSSNTSSVFVQTEPNFDVDLEVLAIVTDRDGYNAVFEFMIPRLYVEISFNINHAQNSAEATMSGSGWYLTGYSDYSFQWYREDISGYEDTEIVGATSRFITDLDPKYDYKLVAINNAIPQLSAENSFAFANRTVIYVRRTGNNNNNGLTPQTPVQTFAAAYSRLPASGTRDENVIVVMGDIIDNALFTGATSTTYRKDVTITGVYKREEYNGFIRLHGQSTYKYVNGNTTMMYLNLDGYNNHIYLYLQGYSFTFGEQVVMTGYTAANTNQGLIAGNAPGFHLLGSWERYNYASLPRNNPKILVKSGTFGRIILGGSPGTNAVANLQNTTSRNFIGGPNDMFNIEVTIDIENSTKSPTHTYDINLLVGGSAAGNNYSNVVENIKSGSVGRVLGASIGDISNRPSNWAYPINTFIGSSQINISGGSVVELYGGALGRNMAALTNSSTLLCDSYFYGHVEINISGGTITGDIYGAGAGGVSGYHPSSSDQYKSYGQPYDTVIDINITGGTITADIYGGGYGYTNYLTERVTTFDAGTLYGTSNINVSGSPTINGAIYGGGRGYNLSTKPEIAAVVGATNINLEGTPNLSGVVYGGGRGLSQYANMAKLTGKSTIDLNTSTGISIYGGGNIAAAGPETEVNILSGTHTQNIFGGGNVGVVNGATNVNLINGNCEYIYGGGNQAAVTTSNVNLTGGQATYVYGGGNQAAVTGSTNTILDGSTINQLMGGSNLTGNIPISNIDIISGAVDDVYGGNNRGGSTITTNVLVEGGSIIDVFGGGNQASSTNTNVIIENGTVTNIYGGSNSANANNTNVEINGGNISGNIFGGSNTTGTVDNSEVTVIGGTMNNVYGGNNAGGITNNTNVIINSGNVTNIYGGSNSTNAGITNVDINGGNISGNIFGGSNTTGTVQTSQVAINSGNVNNVYGGNNQGGMTLSPNVTIEGGDINTVYGGGNMASVPSTNVVVNDGIIETIFGGGDAAQVNANTNVEINGGYITDNIYAGGNEGVVAGSTFLRIKEAEILGSVYAGGNGVTAIVRNNTNISIEKGTIIGNENSNIPAQGCVFGGGNAAETGLQNANNASATVNIVGGNIVGNIYGGANTSVVYGETNVNIGINASSVLGLEKDDIFIGGTIFGGGEANAEGSEVFDFSFISVTEAIHIVMDGSDHNVFDTEGSVFGSGNASSTSGTSDILIKNYGKLESPGKNVSLQRANLITLDNTHISLSGATDRTNEYSNVMFSVSRVDHLKSSNNSTLYMAYGANLLKEYSSLVTANGNALQEVYIDEETGETTRNVDNRIFMLEGKNLNIATNESVTAYGRVNGMSFLGIYTNRTNPNTSTGLYHHSYNNGDYVSNPGTFSYNSYVLAQHKPNHDITVDGFYTNINEENYIKSEYVGVTPEDDIYYIWVVGEALDVTTFEITLTASKYATLGTYELSLTGFSKPNTTYRMFGFSVGMEPGVDLVHVNEIDSIAPTEEIANSLFGLSLKASRTGWKTTGGTNYYTRDGGKYEGTNEYRSEDSPVTPSFLFYLYHSQNLSVEKELGQATIRLQVLEPVDDLNYDVKYIDIIIDMETALYQDDFYEAAITAGKEFELFTTTETNITNKSIFSSYFSLVIPDFSENKHYDDYLDYHRVIVSRRDDDTALVYPAGTKLTMLDLVTNKSYYYIVSAIDQAQGKYVYELSDFIEMGTINKMYNEDMSSLQYLNSAQDIVYENFIFHTSFVDTDINTNYIKNSLWMELRDDSDQTLIGVLGIARDRTKYSIHTGMDSIIDLNAVLEPTTLYLGDILNLDITTTYEQAIIDGARVSDTSFFDEQMGIRISIIDSDGNQLGADSLLGIRFKFEEEYYMPRFDGSVRIKVAETVSNILSKLQVDTTYNQNLMTGDYTIQIESFGSPDGIYYGDVISHIITKDLKIINKKFGLKVTTNDQMKIIDKKTGFNEMGTNALNVDIDYESALSNPRLNMHLERRKYDTIYQRDYEKVDLADFVTTPILSASQNLEYIVSTSPVNGKRTQFLNLGEDLETGTYRVMITLYDGTKFIGSAYEYIIIK